MSPLRNFLVASCFMIATAGSAIGGPVMDEIRKDDRLVCLVNTNSPAFSVPDSEGVYRGFNTDFCRMAAAAILGDAGKADIRGIGFSDSMKTIVAKGAHMASRSITNTGTRDANPGMRFVVTTFFDGQGFMVPRSLGVTSAKELSGATVCAEEGSTTLLNIADWFSDRGIQYRVENIADKTARLQAFFSGKCDVLASDRTALNSDRLLADDPEAYVILPEVISNEPLTLLSQPDAELEKALYWSFQVMLNAEALKVSSGNVDNVVADLADQPKSVQRLFGQDSAAGEMASQIGLPAEWSYNIIKQVGNYGEVYDRSLGTEDYGLERAGTANALFSQGGLMYPLPIR
ncbi:type 2 periplasmic-binding domain-containing protein [Roseibium suaedae]|uniref:General L-amino acid transport system substrate-binding protein n=1 Tax=Roseibium suaedae TaxID=735517 RepID=A0A1M7NJT6_9HYPH|nr:transporter substrate-binding domain-containing protein [Roseibium suaedae]SHN04208.1 general L-amino acid transport system substrate-binding protein [Roseibium suaedae]